MGYTIHTPEPVRDDCDKCGYSGSYDTVMAETDDGEETALCMPCAIDLKKNGELDSASVDALEEAIKLELTEPEFEEFESGWSTEGAYGIFIVEFGTSSEDVQTQVAVDDFKTIGHYTSLSGSGEIILEEPERRDTDVKLGRRSNRKEYINEQRKENGAQGR